MSNKYIKIASIIPVFWKTLKSKYLESVVSLNNVYKVQSAYSTAFATLSLAGTS